MCSWTAARAPEAERRLTAEGAEGAELDQNEPPRAAVFFTSTPRLDSAAALSLDPESRARLAERLLESLYDADDKRLESIWAHEASRRDAEWDADPSAGRMAAEVLRDARSKLR